MDVGQDAAAALVREPESERDNETKVDPPRRWPGTQGIVGPEGSVIGLGPVDPLNN